MRITMNIEDDKTSAPLVNVTTGAADQVAAAPAMDVGEPIDAGPPAFDHGALTDDQPMSQQGAGSGVGQTGLGGADVNANGMNDGGDAPTLVDSESDDTLH